jgi:hypothetical protein
LLGVAGGGIPVIFSKNRAVSGCSVLKRYGFGRDGALFETTRRIFLTRTQPLGSIVDLPVQNRQQRLQTEKVRILRAAVQTGAEVLSSLGKIPVVEVQEGQTLVD